MIRAGHHLDHNSAAVPWYYEGLKNEQVVMVMEEHVKIALDAVKEDLRKALKKDFETSCLCQL